ncbi:MAG: beta-lactamase class D [Candidatus Midichloriaceae bacterium]|jgi:beta-lactamase class D
MSNLQESITFYDKEIADNHGIKTYPDYQKTNEKITKGNLITKAEAEYVLKGASTTSADYQTELLELLFVRSLFTEKPNKDNVKILADVVKSNAVTKQ